MNEGFGYLILRFGFAGARRPWNSVDAGTPLQRTGAAQSDIDRCMMCPLCAECCDRCDGYGNVREKRRVGRPAARYS